MSRKLVLICLPLFFLLLSVSEAHGPNSDSPPVFSPPAPFSEEIETRGRVVVLEAQGADGGHITHVLLKRNRQEQYILRGPALTSLEPGEHLRVNGLLDASKTPFQSAGRLWLQGVEELSRPETRGQQSLGKKGAMIVFPSWSGSGISGYSTYGDYTEDNLADWSARASDGQFVWDPVTVVDLQLSSALPGCEAGGPSGFLPDFYWQGIVVEELKKRGYEMNDYRALAIAMPEGFARECIWSAYAYVDSGCTWGQDYYCNLSVYTYDYSDFSVFVHELGHTLYLPHANHAPCRSGRVPVPLTFQGDCLDFEYGDVYDPMGLSRSGAMYNPASSDQLGWIPEGEIVRRLGSPESHSEETFSLKPYGGLEGIRALSLDLPGVAELGGSSPGKLYLEYRANAGLDQLLYDPPAEFPHVQCLPYTPASNVFLRFIPTAQAADLLSIARYKGLWGLLDESYLLDMKPETNTVCDSGLAPGGSWSDPTGELEVTYTSRASDFSEATLRIARDPWTAPLDQERPALVSVEKPTSPRSDYAAKYVLTFSERVTGLEADDLSFSGGVKCLPAFTGEKNTYNLFLQGCQQGRVQPRLHLDGLSDMAGNLGSGTQVLPAVRFDRFVARPQLKKRPARRSRSDEARFLWRGNREARFSCSLDEGRFRSCRREKVYRDLSLGKHEFVLRAEDRVGNRSYRVYSWRVLRD